VTTTTLAEVATAIAWCDARPVRRVSLNDVVLDCETQVLLKGQRVIRDTTHLVSDEELVSQQPRAGPRSTTRDGNKRIRWPMMDGRTRAPK